MKLMVLDGNSVINRAYYGVRALTTQRRVLYKCHLWLSEYSGKAARGRKAGRALRRV